MQDWSQASKYAYQIFSGSTMNFTTTKTLCVTNGELMTFIKSDSDMNDLKQYFNSTGGYGLHSTSYVLWCRVVALVIIPHLIFVFIENKLFYTILKITFVQVKTSSFQHYINCCSLFNIELKIFNIYSG